MKRAISFLLVLTLVLSGVFVTPKKAEAKNYYWFCTFPKMKTINLSWKANKKATKYQIYRATTKDYEVFPKKSKFKKIKTIKNRKTKKFVDKKVKEGKYYAYYIKALKKKKTIFNTYAEENGVVNIGPCTPDLRSGGYESDFEDGNYSLNLYDFETQTGYKSSPKLEIYRKEKGESKFKKVYLNKAKGIRKYIDNSVKKGNTYSYKARAYIKNKKKKIYSPFSKVNEVYAGNYSAEYNIKSLTPSGLYTNTREMTAVIQITNARVLNGKTVFYRNDNEYDKWDYIVTVNKKEHYYDMTYARFSYDNVNWETIPKEGVELSGSETLYLELKIKCRKSSGYKDEDYENKTIYFGGNDCEYESSQIFAYHSFYYYGPVQAHPYTEMNLKAGKAFTNCDFDY